jgi:hypothetical protein
MNHGGDRNIAARGWSKTALFAPRKFRVRRSLRGLTGATPRTRPP